MNRECRGALLILSAVLVDFGIYRIQLGVSDRRGYIDNVDYVVLPVFPRGGVRTLMIGAGLAGVYPFLYITLRQQDYALLMGAIALFIVLAIVMYVTRKVDWYARDAG